MGFCSGWYLLRRRRPLQSSLPTYRYRVRRHCIYSDCIFVWVLSVLWGWLHVAVQCIPVWKPEYLYNDYTAYMIYAFCICCSNNVMFNFARYSNYDIVEILVILILIMITARRQDYCIDKECRVCDGDALCTNEAMLGIANSQRLLVLLLVIG